MIGQHDCSSASVELDLLFAYLLAVAARVRSLFRPLRIRDRFILSTFAVRGSRRNTENKLARRYRRV